MYCLWLLFCNFTLFIGSSRNYETNNNYNIVFNSFLNCVVKERTYLSALGHCGVDEIGHKPALNLVKLPLLWRYDARSDIPGYPSDCSQYPWLRSLHTTYVYVTTVKNRVGLISICRVGHCSLEKGMTESQ